MKTINKRWIQLSAVMMLGAGISALRVGSAIADDTENVNTSVERNKYDADPRTKMGEHEEMQVDASTTLRIASELYEDVVKGLDRQIPESVLDRSKCIVVLPKMMTGALLVGGSHGAGITSCKENSTWSVPAFVKMNQLSFGAQFGGKSSDIVLFILTEKGKAALKKGNLKLGTDVSIIAGKFDKSMDTSTDGVVVYTRTEGAFAGVSVSGGNIASDDVTTTAYYGKDINYVSLLEGRVITQHNDQADKFTALLPE